MTTFQIIWFAPLIGGLVAILSIIAAKREAGSTASALLLLAGFGAFTGVQIAREGVVGFYTNHSQSLTGLQVWWDLIQCAIIGLFLIAPRARKVGMNLPLWAILVGTTASIGLLAMCARLFWLERQSGAAGSAAR